MCLLNSPCLFQVNPEKGSAFEAVWKERKSTLLETPGFIRFALLRGDAEGDMGACVSGTIRMATIDQPISFNMHACILARGVHLRERLGFKERL
jgi:hypothetical protein